MTFSRNYPLEKITPEVTPWVGYGQDPASWVG